MFPTSSVLPRLIFGFIDDAIRAISQKWAAGADVVRANNLPVSAMLACACVESQYGQGFIFKKPDNQTHTYIQDGLTFVN